jgi:hypothetical protein
LSKILRIFLDVNCGINIQPTREKDGWPWMGSLGSYHNGNWSHFCAASLIDDGRVITAAHCVPFESEVIAK